MIFGIFYFILFFFLGALEHFRFLEEGIIFSNKKFPEYYMYMKDKIFFSNTIYVIIKLLALISFVYFQRGFIFIGGIFKNYLLKIVSFILIFITIILTGYDIVSIFFDSLERQFVLGGTALAFGVIGIIYGVSLVRLHKSVGKIAKYAGIFEIIAGCFFLTIISLLNWIRYLRFIQSMHFRVIVVQLGK